VVTAAQARDAFGDVERVIEEHQAELDRLDAVAGDGDHGATMVMGLRAVAAALPDDEESVAELLRIAAIRFSSVGGSTGPLWGTALLRAAQSLGAAESTDLPAMAAAAAAAAQGIADRGKCAEGDKTLLDVMGPASRALSAAAASGADPADALRQACDAARAGLAATRDLEPKHGRTRLASERSRGHEDAGAASAVLVWETVARLSAR
jgi:phosphoenolpyruvate---glycerone phosphotransferase subunit DhaL